MKVKVFIFYNCKKTVIFENNRLNNLRSEKIVNFRKEFLSNKKTNQRHLTFSAFNHLFTV